MRHSLLALVAFTAVTLASCGQQPVPRDISTPEGAILVPIHAIASGDLATFIETRAPNGALAEAEAWWNENRGSLSEEGDSAEFEEMMGMLTQPGAADALFALAQPQLEQIQAMMPMMTLGFNQQLGSMPKAEGMSDDQYRQAQAVARSIASWTEDLDITDEGDLKEAIDILCATATRLQIRTVADLEACSFDEVIQKGQVLTEGLIDILAVYDLDLREIADSAEIVRVDDFGDRATVTYSIDFFGETMQFDSDLQKVDGFWYDAEELTLASNQ